MEGYFMKLNKLGLILGVALGLGVSSISSISYAQTKTQQQIQTDKDKDPNAVQDKEILDKIGKFVKDNSGELKGVYNTGILDLYEVVIAPADILYVNKDLNRIFVNGALLDVDKKINMTEERKSKALKIDYKDLPKTGFIKIGSGKKEISVFADPNCGFCKKLEQVLAKEKDITFKVYPVAILAPSSLEINRNIMCSANPAKAWSDWMLNGVSPAKAKECKNNGDSNNEYIKTHVINSTPTIFFKNGIRKTGAMDSQALNDEIAKNEK